MNWFSNVNKYLWNSERTPYFTAPEALTGSQAKHEIFAYAILLGSFYGIVAMGGVIAVLREFTLPHVLWLLCGGIVLWACVALVRRRDPLSAWVVALAPAAVLFQIIQSGLEAEAFGPDRLLMCALMLALLRYGWRIIRIARAHRNGPGGTPGFGLGAAKRNAMAESHNKD